jgi:mono/diheme cytochrome c family protein
MQLTKIRFFPLLVCSVGFTAALLSPITATADDAVTGKSPAEVVQGAPKGTLKNPYNPSQQDKVAQGHELFMSYSCNGCHGGTGGGGICPQLNGDVWFFGMDDDTLFRLVALGSVDLEKQGFAHLGGVGTPMPPFGGIIKSDDQLWQIITWIRSIYKGDPKKKTW